MKAVYTVRSVVDFYVFQNTTVNICALDLSKALDKMNRHGLFIKLMERHVPTNLLAVIEKWFACGLTCLKWGNVFSRVFKLQCGIQQGGVLSPHLFAVYVDSLVDAVERCNIGCCVKWASVSIVLYADDILLLSHSVTGLQQLLHVCEQELDLLYMPINVAKSSCMR